MTKFSKYGSMRECGLILLAFGAYLATKPDLNWGWWIFGLICGFLGCVCYAIGVVMQDDAMRNMAIVVKGLVSYLTPRDPKKEGTLVPVFMRTEVDEDGNLPLIVLGRSEDKKQDTIDDMTDEEIKGWVKDELNKLLDK